MPDHLGCRARLLPKLSLSSSQVQYPPRRLSLQMAVLAPFNLRVQLARPHGRLRAAPSPLRMWIPLLEQYHSAQEPAASNSPQSLLPATQVIRSTDRCRVTSIMTV